MAVCAAPARSGSSRPLQFVMRGAAGPRSLTLQPDGAAGAAGFKRKRTMNSHVRRRQRMRRIVFMLVAVAVLAGVVAGSAPASAQAHGEAADAIRPFHIKISDEALTDLRRRLQATRWPDHETVADPSQGVQLGEAAGAGPVLGERLRLAQGGSEAERLAAIHDQHRWRGHSLHPRPLPSSERAAGDHHARLAGLRDRAAEDYRPAHRSRRRSAAARRTPSTS